MLMFGIVKRAEDVFKSLKAWNAEVQTLYEHLNAEFLTYQADLRAKRAELEVKESTLLR